MVKMREAEVGEQAGKRLNGGNDGSSGNGTASRVKRESSQTKDGEDLGNKHRSFRSFNPHFLYDFLRL